MRVHSGVLRSGAVIVLAGCLHAGDEVWPDFRGPSHDGCAIEADVPLVWSETENVRWKTAIRGRGWSTPVVAGGLGWMTSASPDGRQLYAIAVDVETGEIAHSKLVFTVEKPESVNALNSYASPSPVIDGSRVYLHYGTYGTAALDRASGEVLWKRRDLRCDHEEGPGSSPVLFGDLLILNVDGRDVQYVVALRRDSGETVWRADRTAPRLDSIGPGSRKAFSTPIAVVVDGEPQLISTGALETVAYDQGSGAELWKVRHGGFSMASRPIAGEGLVFLNTGLAKTEMWAVRLGGKGDVTGTHVVWKHKRNVPRIPSPVLAAGHIYMVSDQGIATCLDAETGKRRWRERLGGEYCASPIAARGRLYFFDREGRTVVLAAEPEYRVLAENQLAGGFMASPVVVANALLLRTETHLYRIETPASATTERTNGRRDE